VRGEPGVTGLGTPLEPARLADDRWIGSGSAEGIAAASKKAGRATSVKRFIMACRTDLKTRLSIVFGSCAVSCSLIKFSLGVGGGGGEWAMEHAGLSITCPLALVGQLQLALVNLTS
jgi:hypothetical protein